MNLFSFLGTAVQARRTVLPHSYVPSFIHSSQSNSQKSVSSFLFHHQQPEAVKGAMPFPKPPTGNSNSLCKYFCIYTASLDGSEKRVYSTDTTKAWENASLKKCIFRRVNNHMLLLICKSRGQRQRELAVRSSFVSFQSKTVCLQMSLKHATSMALPPAWPQGRTERLRSQSDLEQNSNWS